MDCTACNRTDLPTTAFYPTNLVTCRQCVGERYRGARGRTHLAVECPVCRTAQRNLRRHYLRWHPGIDVPPREVQAEGAEHLNSEARRLRREADRRWSWPPRHAPLIYFVQAGGVGRPVKVGTSTNLAKRIDDMQLGCPDELEVLLTEPGGPDEERALHERFATDWIRGEWFRPSTELLGYVVGRLQSTEVPGNSVPRVALRRERAV